MVHEIMRSKFRVFLEALFLTVLLVMIGFFIGYYVEYSRTNSIEENYKAYEIEALDLKLQNYYYQIMDQASCSGAIEQNLIFADKIYETGLNLERYENVNDLSKDILLEKERYALLKNELWMNSILLKKKCNDSFHTVVYIYTQNTNTGKEAEQAVIANTLKKVKEDYGNEIILIPIAGDLGLDSVTMQLRNYNITYLPSVIIDENILLAGYHPQEEIEKYLGKKKIISL
jgi:hypothetical protein